MTAHPFQARLLFLATLLIAVMGAVLAPSAVLAQAAVPVPAQSTPRGESRSVAAFDAVLVRGPVNVQLRRAAAVGVWVEALDADPRHIDTRVIQHQGRSTLEVSFEPPKGRWLRRAPQVTVDWTGLAAITVQGSGDVLADGVNTPALKVSLQGSGDVTLRQVDTLELSLAVAGSGDVRASGRSVALSVQLAGSGDVDTAELASEAVKVSIAGSGDVSVTASKTLNASIAGSGDLRYAGDARVSSRVAGSGSVTRR